MRPELEEPAVIRELHKIRERLHEEWQDWTNEQLLKHLNREGEKAAKMLGLRIKQRRAAKSSEKLG